MKALKHLFLAIAAFTIIMLLPGLGTMKVKAAATTYTVKYVPANSEWRVQPLSSWDENEGHGTVGYLSSNVKDGDIVIVQGSSDDPALNLKFSASLSNITIISATNYVTVECGTITDAYVLKGSVVDLKTPCKNVYVYDNSVCNIRKDVDLVQLAKATSMDANVLANGTVGHCQFVENGKATKDYYSFSKDTLRIEKGELKTSSASYSTTAPAATETPAASATPAASDSGKSQTSNGVPLSPQTGENSHAIWLFIIAILCFASAFSFKKKAA